MGLMNQMRANMKFVLGFLVVVFVATMSIGGLVGGANITDILSGKKPNAFTTVNGEEISYEQFLRAMDRERKNYQDRSGQEPNEQQLNQLQGQVWDALVTQVLIRQQIEKQEITVTPDEIKYYGTENIHPLIQQYFQDSTGNFDRNQYQQALQSPQAAKFFLAMENQLRSIIPIEKLQHRVYAVANVSESELRQVYIQQQTPYHVEYIFVKNTIWKDTDVEASESDIANYYDTHQADYNQTEGRVLAYTGLPITPVKQDSQITYDRLIDLKKQIEDGRNFEEVAQLNSDDPSASNGGTLGWFGKGRMVPPFEEAAFKAPAGKVVGPVLTRFGYHLIRIDSSRRTNGQKELFAHHILLKITPSQSTRDFIRQELFQVKFLAEEIGFAQAVDSLKLKLNETTPLRSTDIFITGLGTFRPAISFAFRNETGAISDVLSTDNNMAIFQLKSIIPAGARPLEEVSASIKRKLINDKKMELAGSLADSVYGILTPKADLKTVSTGRAGLVYQKPTLIKGTGAIPGVGKFQQVYGALSVAEVGSTLKPVKVNRGYLILKLDSRGKFNETRYNAMRKSLYDKLLKQRQSEAWTNYLAALKNSATIVDNRIKFL